MSTPVSARISAVLPWSMWPAVPSVSGALLGGMILGVTEGIGSIYLPLAFRDVYGLVFLVAILLFKPSGLFAGRR